MNTRLNTQPNPPVIPRLPALGFGGDWNPEQWPESIWDEDIRLMQQAHVNLVTLGVFSWAHLEPEPDRFEFGWLDRVMEKCAAAGIAVDLATATASPPPWLGHRWPETLPVTETGVRLAYGARQQYCPSSHVFHERALIIAEQVVTRYADHDSVVMWHVGNEYGAHTPHCWCDNSAAAFRDWLRSRYGDLDALNDAWSTAFWSQRFSDWAEVIPPRQTPYFPNPTQQLDFKRFSSDAMLALFTAERDLIRAHSPADKPITTNFMRFFPNNDYWSWAQQEDVVSDDWYPDLADPRSHIEGAAGADLMRSLGHGQPWLLMEQAVSAINWRAVNPPKTDQAYRRWSLQQVARGADAILHFQWRASIGGAEKWHSGMLPHAGPRTRTWREVVDLGQELADLRPLAGARTRAEVAIVFDWSAWWALELDSRPNTELSYMSIVLSWYQVLWQRGYSIDFVHPESDLTEYPLVLAPQLYSVSDRGAQNIIDAANGGSTVVIGFFSGATDENDRVRPGGYPAPWVDLLGLWIEEYRPLLPGHTLPLTRSPLLPNTQSAQPAVATRWSEHVHLTTAKAVLTYGYGELGSDRELASDRELHGLAAVTKNTHGPATAWYLSTQLDPATLQEVLLAAAADSNATPIVPTAPPPGVEVAVRQTDTTQFLFLINHSETAHSIPAPPGEWGLSPQSRRDGSSTLSGGEISLAAGDVLVLTRPARPDSERNPTFP